VAIVSASSQWYRAFDVWVRQGEEGLVRYRCFDVIPAGKFCVQSQDFYRPPFAEAVEKQFERQFLGLLSEIAPEVRSGLYDTIEEAIRMHDEEFQG
jgi:hypothetical protein